jgi:hemerythrin superfamily protein
MHLPLISAIGRRMGLGASTPDAITMLKRDHREVDALFAAFEKARSSREKKRIATRVCKALTVHAEIEEKMFYPAAEACLDEDLLVDEARVEHQHLKELVSEIDSMMPSDDMYEAKMRVLMEYVHHHVREEEHEMFPKLRASEMDTEELGAKMAARREQLMRRSRSANGHGRSAKANGHARASNGNGHAMRNGRSHHSGR